MTEDRYHPVEHVALLQVMVVVGAAVSKRIACDLAASLLPAVSTEKNLTVRVDVTLNAPVYRVLDVVGTDPSVV